MVLVKQGNGNLLYGVIGITLRHGCSPVNLMHIFRTAFCLLYFFASSKLHLVF